MVEGCSNNNNKSTSPISNNNDDNNNNRRRRRCRSSRLNKDEATIGIIGCGIAGLSTGISLLQAGYRNVVLFERDDNPLTRREGFGLTLTYNPKGPLAQLGILEQVAQKDCPSRSHYIFMPDGKISGYYGNQFRNNNQQQRGFGQRGNLRIPRQVLQSIMTERFFSLVNKEMDNCNKEGSSSSSSSRIYWDHTLVDIKNVPDDDNNNNIKVKLEFKTTNNGNDGGGHSKEDAETEEKEVLPAKTTTNTTTKASSSKSKSYLFDLVIAADGVRSSVVQILAPQCQPKPLNVMIILGISEGFQHPLLIERGFYTVGDGKHRLFTMPYEGDRYTNTSDNHHNHSNTISTTKRRRIMWQMSYRYNPDDGDGVVVDELDTNCTRDPAWLQQRVLEICSDWHDPVPSLIKATPLQTIWGTPLYDRSPKELELALLSHPRQRILVVGDALHAMSPFKGQGANNALMDGPLIANWLQRAKVDAAVRGIWREVVARTDKVVKSSREAAQFWHSKSCIPASNNSSSSSSPYCSNSPSNRNDEEEASGQQQQHQRQQQVQPQQQLCQFAGVAEDSYDRLIKELSKRNITAALASKLDESIAQVIEELGIGKEGNDTSSYGVGTSSKKEQQQAAVAEEEEEEDPQKQKQLVLDIMNFAAHGITSELRNISLTNAYAIRFARDEDGKTTLHHAAKYGHYETCRWLLDEVHVDPFHVDKQGRSALDDASSFSSSSCSSSSLPPSDDNNYTAAAVKALLHQRMQWKR